MVDRLVGDIRDQLQIFETVVDFVAVDVVNLHSARNGTMSGPPDDTVFEIALTGCDPDSDVAGFGDGALTAAPVPVVPSFSWRATLVAVLAPVWGAIRRVELRASGPARLTGLRIDSSHVGMIRVGGGEQYLHL